MVSHSRNGRLGDLRRVKLHICWIRNAFEGLTRRKDGGGSLSDQSQGAYALVLHEGAVPETGGIAVCGFSTVGMVGVIAASHIISSLGLNHLGTVLNTKFPAIALVHDEVPVDLEGMDQYKDFESMLQIVEPGLIFEMVLI